MSAAPPVREPSVLIRSATWQTYCALRDADENRHVRMTFDRGSLELMSPSKSHERIGHLIGRCVEIWTMERGIPMQGCRSTTFRREDLERGFEPDNCYYIQHEPVVREREEVDLTIDPPPDLMIEVDVRSSSINRMSIFAAMGVPEVWRWKGESLQVFLLDESGRYQVASASRALPGFPFERMNQLLAGRTETDETTLIREFREFVREVYDQPHEE